MKNYCTNLKPDMMEFWIKNNLNVLLIGKAGVGKTHQCLEAFKKSNIKFRYFSASTMDPWVDFIGVPKEMKDEKGSYLELVKPKEFRDDEVEALFFDEFNRSSKKIRNAVMELIQFKSINGRKFPNLKFVWAAINPDDDESQKYDVEPLDAAQKDRFHVHIELPYKPQVSYFRDKYGKDVADPAIDWWNKLPEEVKLLVSPRRLDTALHMHTIGGNLRHVLPPDSNLDKLCHSLKNGVPLQNLAELVKAGDKAAIKKWLTVENNFDSVKDDLGESDFAATCLPAISSEKLLTLMQSNAAAKKYVFANAKDFEAPLKSVATSGQNAVFTKAVAKILKKTFGSPTEDTITTLQKRTKLSAAVAATMVTPTPPKFNVSCPSKVDLAHLIFAAPIFASIDEAADLATAKRIVSTTIRRGCLKTLLNIPIKKVEEAPLALALLEWAISGLNYKILMKNPELHKQLVHLANYLIFNEETASVKNDAAYFHTKYKNIIGKIFYENKFTDTAIHY